MQRSRLPALLLTHLPDVRYLCGFTGSNAALVVLASGSRVRARLFTDGRYRDQASAEVHGATVRIAPKSVLAEAAAYLSKSAVTHCGLDAAHTTLATESAVRKALRSASSPCRLRAVNSPVARLREVKDDDEQALLARAAALGCHLYEDLLTFIEPGMREIDIAAELEHRARLAGAAGMSFETIVAAGSRSSMPHAHASTAVIRPGELLTLDFGIMLDGYASDMTRTVQVGQGGSVARRTKQRAVFEAVLAAQEAAVAQVRDGVAAGDVDCAARSVLEGAGLAKWFTHSTGHGLGLEIHEGPRIAANQAEPLRTGMVVTVEPGVYLPGEFGVRIEDTVRVTDTGCEILTPA